MKTLNKHTVNNVHQSNPIVIVGRGISGLTSALELKKSSPDQNIIVIGPKPQQDQAASRAALGVMTSKGLLLGRNLVFAKKMEGGHKLLHHLPQEVPHFLGMIEPFSDRLDFRKKKERCYHRAPTGAFLYKTAFGLEAKESLGGLYSFFADQQKWQGGFFYPQDGWFHPVLYLEYLEKTLIQSGVSFIDDWVETIDSEKQISLKSGQNIIAKIIALATGFGTESLFQRSHIHEAPTLYSSLGITKEFKAPKPDLSHGVLKFGRQSLISWNQKIYGGGFSPSEKKQSDLDLQKICKNLEQTDEKKGLRIFLKNKEPFVGKIPLPHGKEHIFGNFGYDKNGFALAEAGALKLCEEIRQHLGLK